MLLTFWHFVFTLSFLCLLFYGLSVLFSRCLLLFLVCGLYYVLFVIRLRPSSFNTFPFASLFPAHLLYLSTTWLSCFPSSDFSPARVLILYHYSVGFVLSCLCFSFSIVFCHLFVLSFPLSVSTVIFSFVTDTATTAMFPLSLPYTLSVLPSLTYDYYGTSLSILLLGCFP